MLPVISPQPEVPTVVILMVLFSILIPVPAVSLSCLVSNCILFTKLLSLAKSDTFVGTFNSTVPINSCSSSVIIHCVSPVMTPLDTPVLYSSSVPTQSYKLVLDLVFVAIEVKTPPLDSIVILSV